MAVVDAPDPSQEHVRGRVVDETRNMVVVDGEGEEKPIPKHGSRFRVEVPGGFEVDGDEIRFRPEDRVKKARSIEWRGRKRKRNRPRRPQRRNRPALPRETSGSMSPCR